MKERAATDGIAPELGYEQNGSGGHEEDSSEVAMLASMWKPKDDADGNRKEAEGDVGLYGMNRNEERRSAPTLGEWIGVGDGPRNMRACAVTGTGEECSQLFEGEAKSRGCGENVGRGPQRKVLPKGVGRCNGECDEGSDGGDERMVNHGEAEHPEGMIAEHRPVSDDEQEPRTDERVKSMRMQRFQILLESIWSLRAV